MLAIAQSQIDMLARTDLGQIQHIASQRPFVQREAIPLRGHHMYAVCVNFHLKPGTGAAFMPLILDNAATSLRDEPACHQFDVAQNSREPDAVFLYELYSDRAAFDAHLASAHFQAFDTAIAEMIADKIIQTWDTVHQ